ncbi:MAG: PilZ domain-containing protein [Thermodesulfobacteriota bacterium]
MNTSEIVSGQEKIDIFSQMEKEGIIINVHLRGSCLKHLAVIKRLTTKKKEWYFLIECPQSFKSAKPEVSEWELAFAFIGDQGVPYRFITSGGGMVGDRDVLIPVPESIERIHRRKHFRIRCHPAALLKAKTDGGEVAMKMVDISQGGSLVMFPDNKGRMLAKGQILMNIRIMLLPGEKEEESLRVGRAEVRSVSLEPKSGLYHFGLMFADLNQREEKAIKDRIYVDQRQTLRKKSM